MSPVRWSAKLTKLRNFDFKGHVSPKAKDRLVKVTKQSTDAANPLDDIRQLLGVIDLGNPPAGFDPSDSISTLTDLVAALQRTPTEPCVTESTKEAILKSRDVLDGMRQADSPYPAELWKGFQQTSPVILAELEKALSTPVKDPDSAVQRAVSDVVKELRAKVNYVIKRMATFYPCVKGLPTFSPFPCSCGITSDSVWQAAAAAVAWERFLVQRPGRMAPLATSPPGPKSKHYNFRGRSEASPSLMCSLIRTNVKCC
jgi:hypothetical protein